MAPKEKTPSRSSGSRKGKASKGSSPMPKASTENYPPRYPQCLREAKQVRDEYLIPVMGNPGNFVLGPIYYPHAPVELPTYYPVNSDEPLLLSLPGLHRTGWASKGTIRSWPTVFLCWKTWVHRMKKFLAPSWREMNLYEAIDLSTKSFELNPNLIAAAACFWSVSSNTFVFPCGLMTPNVLDIIHLTGLSCLGEEVNAALNHKPYDPPFTLSEGSCSYANFISKYAESDDQEPSLNEKIAFYLYWLNKYVLCVAGIKITKEYVRLAVCLAQDMKLALAPFVLGTLYKGLWYFVRNKITNNCPGPFWILQAWLYAYFPAIKPLSICRTKDGEQYLSYAEYLLSHEPKQENTSFKRYFTCFYTPSTGNVPDWLPFKECSYATSKGIKPILQLMIADGVVNQFWATILIPRFISVGFSPSAIHFSNCSFEIYCPNQCARQFGLVQGIPVPYTHPRIKDLVQTRPNVTNTDVIKELVGHFKRSATTFQFESFVANPASTPEYNFWWKCTEGILFTRDLENCLFRLDSENTKSGTISKEPCGAQVQRKEKRKKVASAEDLGNLKKKTRSSKAVDVIHNQPTMADSRKGYKTAVPEEEMTSKEEAEDSETIGMYKRRARRKLQLQSTSDEEISIDKGSVMKVCSFMEPEPLNIAPNIELILEHEVQRSQENTGREEGEMLEQLKLTKIGSVSVQNLDVQSFPTISSACDTGVREPIISAEVAEKLIEPNADVSVTDTIIAQPTVVQEDIVPLNKQIQCNVEVECQPTFMSSKHKDAVQSVLLQEMDAVPAENMSVISFSSDMIPQILDAEQGTDEQRNIGCEPLLLTEITEVQEKAQDTEVFASDGQEFATGKDPIALRLLVNEVNPELITTCSSELDLMLNKAKLYSESLSRSVTGFSESLTPSAFYELSEDTKKELESFFRMLEVPLAEIANNHSIAFSESVSRLIAKKVLPLSEHIRLEKFWATLSENLTTAAICQKQMKEKRDSIDQFANVSKDLDTMGNNIEHLKVKLHQIDMEEAELITRLGQLKEERKSLLTEKESINHKLANINYNEQEIEVMVSVARSNFLENQEMYNLIDNKWSYFKRLFMEFKSKIR